MVENKTKIKKFKKSKKIKKFDSFDYLIILVVFAFVLSLYSFLYFAAFAQNRKWNYCHVTKQHVIFVSFSLTFVEVRCMGNIIIIQKIKTIKDFDYFDSLINWEGVHTFYLNEGQCSTDEDLWKLIINHYVHYTNGYNSIPCYGWT